MKQIRLYNDGIIDIKKQIKQEIDYKSKYKKNDDFVLVNTLRFKYKTCRQEDSEFIKSLGHVLSKKIKTPFVEISSSHMGFINGDKYSIIYIDEDIENKEMYIFLEKAVINND